MAASAGTIVVVGQSTKRTYSLDVYIPDAVATLLTFNPSGLATTTSASTFRLPENGIIIDVTTAAAPTAVGGTLTVNGAAAAGGTFRWADRLNTLSTRAALAIPIKAGDLIGVLQH
jgi:hypothetical protein